MKRLGLLLVVFASAAFAAESQHDKDIAACKIEADNALAKAVVKSPNDVTKVKRDAFNVCMHSKGKASGPIRAK